MEKKMSNKIKVIGTLAILFSVISMVLGLFFFFNNRTFVKNAIRTEGRIIDVKRVTTPDGKTSYGRIFVFTDENDGFTPELKFLLLLRQAFVRLFCFADVYSVFIGIVLRFPEEEVDSCLGEFFTL